MTSLVVRYRSDGVQPCAGLVVYTEGNPTFWFESHVGAFSCEGCAFHPKAGSFYFADTEHMLRHLHKHTDAGHVIPAEVEGWLREDAEMNDAHMAAFERRQRRIQTAQRIARFESWYAPEIIVGAP